MWTIYLIKTNRSKGEPFFDEVATLLPSGQPLDFDAVDKYQRVAWSTHKRIMLGVWENQQKRIAA